jgi:hypothetical protein
MRFAYILLWSAAMQITTTEPRQLMAYTREPAWRAVAGAGHPKRRKAPRRLQRRTTGAGRPTRSLPAFSLACAALGAAGMIAAALVPPVPALPPTAAMQDTLRR